MNRAERRRAARRNHSPASGVWLLAFYGEAQELIGGSLVQAEDARDALRRSWELGFSMDGAVAVGGFGGCVCEQHANSVLSVQDVLAFAPELGEMPEGPCIECGNTVEHEHV